MCSKTLIWNDPHSYSFNPFIIFSTKNKTKLLCLYFDAIFLFSISKDFELSFQFHKFLRELSWSFTLLVANGILGCLYGQ